MDLVQRLKANRSIMSTLGLRNDTTYTGRNMLAERQGRTAFCSKLGMLSAHVQSMMGYSGTRIGFA
jgi:hypothetical protein